jgi:hypothetical protein
MKRISIPIHLSIQAAVAMSMPFNLFASPPEINSHQVVWESPSADATGVMPIGNGEIAAGVAAIRDGNLQLLLASNDAYNYVGDLFKTGKVEISLNPNPFKAGAPFRQTLDLESGAVVIEADGVSLRIWADANRAVYHVGIESPRDLEVNAAPKLWTRFDSTPANSVKGYRRPDSLPRPDQPTQDVRIDRSEALLWYYHVGDRSVYQDDLDFYGVPHMAAKFEDPFRFNTFGNLLKSPQLKPVNGALRGTGRKFDIRIHALTMRTKDPENWIREIESLARKPLDVAADWQKHREWWRAFWQRGWISASDRTVAANERLKLRGEADADGRRREPDGAVVISQNYSVFRYLMACQSRGRVPTKFNGGLFTQQLRVPADTRSRRQNPQELPDGTLLTHEDDRLWGRRFTYQNQRLLYWPLLASGDSDLMSPFFRYYRDLLPVRSAITQAWFGHEGAYFRENIEPTGGERDCGEDGRPPKTAPGQNKGEGYYHSYYFTSGLETTTMMLDYVRHTGDTNFCDEVLVPFAREVLLFFDKHYPRDPDGKLRLDPAMVLETFWIAVNPAPDIAGLRVCLDGLLEMGAGTEQDRKQWSAFRSIIPEIPLHQIDGRTAIAPAASWEKKKNFENGELYPVFPFQCFGVAKGSGQIADWTMRHRTIVDANDLCCWTQDQIHWAYVGNALEAANGLLRRFRTASTMCRFPLYGREFPDSCPDLDHLGSGSIALQRMLVQEADGKILLLPAWPAAWDVDFKLHLSRSTVIEGTVVDGKLTHWKIEPASRAPDVTVLRPQPGELREPF